MPNGTARLLNLKGFEIYARPAPRNPRPAGMIMPGSRVLIITGQVRVAFCVFLEYGGSSYNAVVLTRDLLTRMAEAGII